MSKITPQAVLFDLDGTLLDTAADLGAALNAMLRQRKCAELPFHIIRPLASHGSRGLLQRGFGPGFNADTEKTLRDEFLARYAANIAEHTHYFAGIEALLTALNERQIKIGIVTNKPHAYTMPLLAHFPLLKQLPSIVSGDTLSVAKPHPGPLLLAAEQLKCNAEECWYVGDAERDIEAGNRANMTTIVADWGYIGEADQPEHWGADLRLKQPLDLLGLLS